MTLALALWLWPWSVGLDCPGLAKTQIPLRRLPRDSRHRGFHCCKVLLGLYDYLIIWFWFDLTTGAIIPMSSLRMRRRSWMLSWLTIRQLMKAST